MEADKSHHLLSESWRPRKAVAIIQSKSEGLRTWGADGVDGVNASPRGGEAEMRCPSSISEAGKNGKDSPFSAFWSVRVLKDWMSAPTWGKTSVVLSPPIPMSISPGNTLPDTPKIMFDLGIRG